MLRAALLTGAALLAAPAAAQQQPISPMAGGRISASQPLATTTGATAASRVKAGSALETQPSGIIAATGGGLIADDLARKDDDARDTKTAKKKPAAAMGASLVTDDAVAANAEAAKIPDVDASPGDRRPTAVVVRRPAPVAGPKRQK